MTYAIDDKSLVLIDLKKTSMTVDEFDGKMYQYRSWPTLQGYEIYLDGETRTIRAKEKAIA